MYGTSATSGQTRDSQLALKCCYSGSTLCTPFAVNVWGVLCQLEERHPIELIRCVVFTLVIAPLDVGINGKEDKHIRICECYLCSSYVQCSSVLYVQGQLLV